MVQNKAFIFKKVPTGWPAPGEHVGVEASTFDEAAPAPEGGITTQNLYASFDPYMRGRLRDPSVKSYAAPFELGKPFPAGGVGKVLKSNNDNFKEGDLILGSLNIEEYSSIPADALKARNVRKLQNPYNLNPEYFIGSLGMPGLTAYSSLYEIGKPKKGETIFVSAASGAVGQLVGQLALHEGLTVIGSVGNDEKLEFITKELGFQGGFNYKKERPGDALKRLAPNGIDIYYENVGGEQLEAALDAMNNFGRIVACGMVSQYNLEPHERYGVKNTFQIVGKRITMRGFIVGDADMGPKYIADLHKNVGKWIAEGSFKVQQSITDGIDNAPEGFVGMLRGDNFGKAVLKIADP